MFYKITYIIKGFGETIIEADSEESAIAEFYIDDGDWEPVFQDFYPAIDSVELTKEKPLFHGNDNTDYDLEDWSIGAPSRIT